jgi:hypothetical protein
MRYDQKTIERLHETGQRPLLVEEVTIPDLQDVITYGRERQLLGKSERSSISNVPLRQMMEYERFLNVQLVPLMNTANTKVIKYAHSCRMLYYNERTTYTVSHKGATVDLAVAKSNIVASTVPPPPMMHPNNPAAQNKETRLPYPWAGSS